MFINIHTYYVTIYICTCEKKTFGCGIVHRSYSLAPFNCIVTFLTCMQNGRKRKHDSNVTYGKQSVVLVMM